MKKIVKGLVLLAFVVAFSSCAFAAKYAQNGNVKTPTYIAYEDLLRLQDVAGATRGGSARIVNLVRYNGSNTSMIVRLEITTGEHVCLEDYIVTVYPYAYDDITKEVTSLPFKTLEEGTAMFGPSWYYVGLFDEVDHNSCGFAVVERIKRWSSWADLTFSGITYRGVGYTGSYPQSCDQFLADHQS